MASVIFTAGNSQTSGYYSNVAGLNFLMTADGYILADAERVPAFNFQGGNLNATINGTLMSGSTIAALYLGTPNGAANLGHNSVTIGATGTVQGYDGISSFNGASTVINNGTIRSTGLGELFDFNRHSAGIYATGGGDTIVNHGDISGYYGVYLQGSSNKVVNTGTISGNYNAINAYGSLTLENHGTISGGMEAQNAEVTIVNYGTMLGDIAIGDKGYVTNYGEIDSFRDGSKVNISNGGTMTSVDAGAGSSIFNGFGGSIRFLSVGTYPNSEPASGSLTNNGSLGRVVFGDGGDVTVVNTGTTGDVFLGAGNNIVTNTGIMASLTGGAGLDRIENSGTIGANGNVSGLTLGGGANTVLNRAGATISGPILLTDLVDLTGSTLINQGLIASDPIIAFPYPSVYFGDGADTLTNTGLIRGRVGMNGGDDTVDTSAGTIDGLVELGDGRDGYTGGVGVDRVKGGGGNDLVDLGAGDDVFRASARDGNDVVEGGDGVDTYNTVEITLAVTIDLSAGVAARAAGADTISDFENIVAGRGDDRLVGADGVNRIDGGGGADLLQGRDGNDRLIGDIGADTLTGGVGRDVMTGDTLAGTTREADVFTFASGETGVTAGTRDVITDFTDHGAPTGPFDRGADTIDLSAIDADAGTAGNQAFTFNAVDGGAFSGVAGSLIWQQRDGFALVSGDVNGDKVADFTVQLNGTHTLFATDFVL